MNNLKKRLGRISGLLQKINLNLRAAIVPKMPKQPIAPNSAPPSKKNPIKIMEQKQDNPQVKVDLEAAKIKNAGQWKNKLKMSQNGQWSLSKEEGVIGTTTSGKPIYANARHASHKQFSTTDHQEAIRAHHKKAKEYSGTPHAQGFYDQAEIHLKQLEKEPKD